MAIEEFNISVENYVFTDSSLTDKLMPAHAYD